VRSPREPVKALINIGFDLLATFLLAGCGGGDSPYLTRISVSPNHSSVLLGQSQQFTATGLYSDGTTQNLTPQVTWNSSAQAVATISNAASPLITMPASRHARAALKAANTSVQKAGSGAGPPAPTPEVDGARSTFANERQQSPDATTN
jgi:hypothetical protein